MPTVEALPWSPDLAIVIVPRMEAVEVTRALAAVRCQSVIFYTAGFAEIGEEGDRIQKELVSVASSAGMRILGPNCQSIMVARNRINLTGNSDIPLGKLAFISQSGNLLWDFNEYASDSVSGLGLSLYVHVGNQADLTFAEFFEYLVEDDSSAAVAIYIEGLPLGGARRFLEAARRLTAVKPVVALIGGRTKAGRRSSVSHTASLLSNTRELSGLCRQAGFVEIDRLDALFPVADALMKCPPAKTNSVALCGSGGGHATLAADAFEASGISLSSLQSATQENLRAMFPSMASVRNPIDWTGAPEVRGFRVYEEACSTLLSDPDVGGVVFFGLFGGYMSTKETPEDNYYNTGLALGKLQQEFKKPVFLHSVFALQRKSGMDALRESGVPFFRSLEVAAAAYRSLVQLGRRQGCNPLPDITAMNDLLEPYANVAHQEGRSALLEPEALQWLDALGLPTCSYKVIKSVGEAANVVGELGGPIVLKLVSPDVLHKSDIGGVVLGVRTPEDAKRGFERLAQISADYRVRFAGVLAVQMAPPGVEIALGAARSELGGYSILFASGGTAIEALDDTSVRMAPIDVTDAAEMIEETLAGRMLANPRGMSPPSLEPLKQLMVCFSIAVAASDLIESIDLNPVRVSEDGIRVLDARVILGRHRGAALR